MRRRLRWPFRRAQTRLLATGGDVHRVKAQQLYTLAQEVRERSCRLPRCYDFPTSNVNVGEISRIMKNLFQREAVDEVISRIDTLQPATQRLWGKMDVAQMMAHCCAALDVASGQLNLARLFIAG